MAHALSGATPNIFSFNTRAVRVVVRDGEPWFVATDVCAALGYVNTSKAVADHLDDDERSHEQLDRSRMGSKAVVINESGLYALVLRSRKPEARKFAKWVTGEVLPSIRQTGGYTKPTADAQRLKQAYELATEVAAVAARTVFDALISDQAANPQDRWMFTLTYDRDGKPTAPWAKPVDGNAMVVSMADLPRRLLEPNGMLPSNKELADLAAACNQRLAQRMEYEARKAVAA